MSVFFQNFSFKEFDEGFYVLRPSPYLKKVINEGQADIATVLQNASDLGEDFLHFFWGIIPDDHQYFHYTKGERVLPWESEDQKCTADLIESIAQRHAAPDFDPDQWWNYIHDETGDPRSQLQEIAVAGLFEVDDYLTELLFRGNLWLAMRYQNNVHCWLQTAHIFIRERIFRSPSEIASIAATARHAENRAMKQEVWDWYASHGHNYRSMDAAASAVAGRIAPIAFRTARSWIGEYCKSLLKPPTRRL